MKMTNRVLLVNRYYSISFLLIILISFFSWFFLSQYDLALFVWNPPNHLTRQEYLDLIFPFANYPVEGFSIMQLLLPVFSGMIVLPFFQIKKIFSFAYTRTKSYKTMIVKIILKNLLIGCTYLFVAYLVFLCIGASFLPIREDVGAPRELFTEILGKNFFYEHMFLFYVIDGFLKFFVFPLVYGLFAIAVSFLTNKEYVALLLPIAYFLVLDILISVLNAMVPIDIFFLSPAYTIMSNTRVYLNGFAILAPLLPPLVFSLGVICWKLCIKQKGSDVYAIA